MMNKRGFTLIEILIVASIIALLASIIFASLNRGKVKAAEAKAIQETRQIETALELYRSTYDSYPVNDSGDSLQELQDALVPEFISEVEDIDIPVFGICSNLIQYKSYQGVAKDSHPIPDPNVRTHVYKCGTDTTVPDKAVLFYPTTETLETSEMLMGSVESWNPHVWYYSQYYINGGSCNFSPIAKNAFYGNIRCIKID